VRRAASIPSGLKRRGFDDASISAIKQAYKTLYRSKLGLAEAKAELAKQAAGGRRPSPLRRIPRQERAGPPALKRVAIVAGESSGDLLGAALIRAVRAGSRRRVLRLSQARE
jgi:hypothetical protein